jgi:predicted ribonuclease toxin of YeeF-YezG toxin-antitoxin module
MIEEKALNERLKLVEKELATISDEFDKVEARFKELEDLKDEIKALKVCLGKFQPGFKDEFLSAMKKVTK